MNRTDPTGKRRGPGESGEARAVCVPPAPTHETCEECGSRFELEEWERRCWPAGRTRCPKCACPTCDDLGYVEWAYGDEDRMTECPDCGGQRYVYVY